MGADGKERGHAVAAWLGVDLAPNQIDLLETYAAWLRDEAIPAGGLGPREASRLWGRHLADSLTFATGWRDRPPEELVDVGTGVGLPGIPLAILWPECYVTLLDRGGRRTRLARRIVRMLALPRVAVVQADIFAVADEWEALVFRGSVTAMEAVGLSSKLLGPGGRSVVGLSRRPGFPDTARDLGGVASAMGLTPEVVEVPPEILDGAAWLLIMSRT